MPASTTVHHDEWIKQTLIEVVRRHPYLAREHLTIEVDGGVVHMSGVVAYRLAKQAAWDVAWSIRDVHDVDFRVAVDTGRTAHPRP